MTTHTRAQPSFPARASPRLAEALREALARVLARRLHTTHHENPDDDDEDPTRRLGATRGRSQRKPAQ
jgi:hypothetical protein